MEKKIKLHHSVTELSNIQVRQKGGCMRIISIIFGLLLYVSLAFAGELMEKQSLKHGVSELGNLQVYLVTDIVEDGKIIASNRSIAYTPKDTNNMEDWDERSKDIVLAVTTQEVKDAFNLEKQELKGVGLEKITTYDRTIEKDASIKVRQVNRVYKDGEVFSKKYHRRWIVPGDNPDNNDVISKAVAKKLHTEKVILDYKKMLKEREEKLKGGVL